MAVLLFTCCKVSPRQQWQDDPLSLDASKAVKGFAALYIVFGHIAQALKGENDILYFFTETGVLFVGMFFFLSGYGLYTNLKTKENYLKGFLKKRLITVLVPFYVCILVFTAAAAIFGRRFTALELLGVISGWSLINSHMWFIVEIVILYVAFYLIYRFVRNRTKATVVMTVFVILLMTGSFLLCHGDFWFMGEWWYNTPFLFIVGIVFSRHKEVFLKIARKEYVFLLPIFALLTIAFAILTKDAIDTHSYWSETPGEFGGYIDKICCLSVQLPWIIIFMFFMILVMMKVKFGNPVLRFLGMISLELYLIHNLFVTGLYDFFYDKFPNASVYIVLTILLSAGLATALHFVDKFIIARLRSIGGTC